MGPRLSEAGLGVLSVALIFTLLRVSHGYAQVVGATLLGTVKPSVIPDNTDIFDSTGTPTGVAGLLTSTTNDSREIQFALKVVW